MSVESRRRLARFAYVVAFAIFATVGVIEGLFVFSVAMANQPDATVGMDLHISETTAGNWEANSGFYLPRQLAGPYEIQNGDEMYPPVLLYLVLPFNRGVPAVLWWALPIAVTAAAIVRARPTAWRLALLAMILVYPRAWEVILYGNPSMWAFAALAAGCVWNWPGLLATIKPTLGLFALCGNRSRSWWICFTVVAAISLPFGGMWLDYVRVIGNARNPFGVWYTLGEWPIAAALVVALSVGSARRRPAIAPS